VLVGRVIGDRYRLLQPIAEGLQSAVFKAEHVRMGKALCVKILRGPHARDPEFAARLRTLARAVSRLSHPHTIAVFDFGELEENEGFYVAMEYLHGENLREVLRREGRLPEARAAAIGEQLLGALGEAHAAGIFHRDVKPANVMLLHHRDGGDFVKLLDFGIAEIEGQGPGGGLGTPTYLSPEQARGATSDARSDLYSLGVMLYEMVAGRPPFQAANPMAALSAHQSEEPAPLARLCPDVSPGFAAVVHRALAKRPEDRFGTADEMRGALHAAEARRALATPVPPEPLLPGDAAAEGAEVTETTDDLRIARRADFPVEAGPARKDLRRVLLPGAIAVVAALAALLAASHLHGNAPTDAAEIEPNDSPASPPGSRGYAEWRDLASRNALGEADAIRARTGGGDVDTFAVGPHVRGEGPDVVLLVPQPGLALEVSAWAGEGTVPGMAAAKGFEPLARAGDGQPVLARLPGRASGAAPVLLRVRAAGGAGEYRVVALGPGETSGKAVLGQIRELETAGRVEDALVVAAGFARLEPASPARGEVLRAAARLAESAGGKHEGAGPGGPTP
jgi:serine/threonine-protein kinase